MASRNLYVGNIHPETQTHEMREIFNRYGPLERCEVRFGGPGKMKRIILNINELYHIEFFSSLYSSIWFYFIRLHWTC